MKEYKHAVFIGRFQPFHNGHLKCLEKALEIADEVLILVGSYKAPCNIKNPLTYEERVKMIQHVIDDRVTTKINEFETHTTSSGVLSRVSFAPIRDYFYNDNLWVTEVQHKVSKYIDKNETVVLVGMYKDSSSYYLNLFPQWEFVPVEQDRILNATQVRNKLYKRTENTAGFYNEFHPEIMYQSIEETDYKHLIPEKANNWLINNYLKTERYHNHVLEHNFIEGYKAQWSKAPFPPVFVTTDSIVVCSGHVLVVERGMNPGKGFLALPGGFIKNNEKLEDGALRELKEETGIGLQKLILKNSIVETKVFDYPGRSLRGRTITHGFYIRLKDGELPELKAGDDANKAFWMSLNDVANNEDLFYEDHFHIINYFVRRT